jgi:hypothetical protein
MEDNRMAGPCLTTAPTLDDPLTIQAKPGQINLKLTGTVFFDPQGTDVVTTTGAKVAYTCSGQALSFTGVAGTSYFVEILHGGTSDASTGTLVEDCTGGVTLATLSAANTFSRLQVVVSGGGK